MGSVVWCNADIRRKAKVLSNILGCFLFNQLFLVCKFAIISPLTSDFATLFVHQSRTKLQFLQLITSKQMAENNLCSLNITTV